ncbi:hypothetical protein BDY19DRAFT_951903 [Irpex rosettiformis]|uniref:Uncharacterized protein n=1 Tax=Irpex rosettiformis TaxID=378272 RepID=A0ACB8U144_9APHY|nr:hypothetical protein BDY19DRAFT_951903 [Irpex rosettiformis]
MFSLSQIPERGDLLLVTDELASPADFVLHANLATHLKDSSKDARCIVLSVSGSLSRWKTLATKSNLNVPNLIAKGSLVFIDIEADLEELHSASRPSLRHIFDRLVSILQDEDHTSDHTLLIVDDISTLEWICFSTQEVSRFVRALSAACDKTNTSLIIRHHVITPGNPDELLRLLLQISAYRIDVFPLSTGRSGSVSGQIALHPGPGRTGLKTIPRSKAVLYRLTDTSSTFFDRGTGAAVL